MLIYILYGDNNLSMCYKLCYRKIYYLGNVIILLYVRDGLKIIIVLEKLSKPVHSTSGENDRNRKKEKESTFSIYIYYFYYSPK